MDIDNAKLITEVDPNSLVFYKNMRVGFYDKIIYKGKEKGDVLYLYIYIENMEDNGKTVIRRAVRDRRIRGKHGDLTLIPETTSYARAYNRYLDEKKNNKPSEEQLRIKELEQKLKDIEEPPVAEPTKEVIKLAEKPPIEINNSEKTIKELKEELDILGIKYTAHSTKEVLLELLFKK